MKPHHLRGARSLAIAVLCAVGAASSGNDADSRPAGAPATGPAQGLVPLERVLRTGTPVTASVRYKPLVEGLKLLSATSGNPTFVSWNRSMALDLLEQDDTKIESLPNRLQAVLQWPCAPGKHSARDLGVSIMRLLDPTYLGPRGTRGRAYLTGIARLGQRPVWIDSHGEPYWQVLQRTCIMAGLRFQPGRAPKRQRYVEVLRRTGEPIGREAIVGPLFVRLGQASLRIWIEPRIAQCGMLVRRISAGREVLSQLLPRQTTEGEFVVDISQARLPARGDQPVTVEILVCVPTGRRIERLTLPNQPLEKVLRIDNSSIQVRFSRVAGRPDRARLTLAAKADPQDAGFAAVLAMDRASVRSAPTASSRAKVPLVRQPETSLSWRAGAGRSLLRHYVFQAADPTQFANVRVELPTTVIRGDYTVRFEAQ